MYVKENLITKYSILNKLKFSWILIRFCHKIIDYQLYILFKTLNNWIDPLWFCNIINTISSCIVTRYLFEISQYILLPIYSFIRLFVYSFDVIHTLGFYSWAIKIDAIPGRINLANTLRLLWKGEYRGRCFELCGQGHLSMIISSK